MQAKQGNSKNKLADSAGALIESRPRSWTFDCFLGPTYHGKFSEHCYVK